MTVETIQADVAAVQGVAETILTTIGALDPAVEVPVEVTEKLVTLVGGLAAAALTALQNATGTPITQDTIAALLPNPAPLPDPS